MTDSSVQIPGQAEGWIKQTALYRQSLRLREEIDLHKWYESERAGRDIGWEKASVGYLLHHCSDR